MKALKLFGLLVFLGWIGLSIYMGTERIIFNAADFLGISINVNFSGYIRVFSGLIAYLSMFAVVHPKLKVELPKHTPKEVSEK